MRYYDRFLFLIVLFFATPGLAALQVTPGISHYERILIIQESGKILIKDTLTVELGANQPKTAFQYPITHRIENSHGFYENLTMVLKDVALNGEPVAHSLNKATKQWLIMVEMPTKTTQVLQVQYEIAYPIDMQGLEDSLLFNFVNTWPFAIGHLDWKIFTPSTTLVSQLTHNQAIDIEDITENFARLESKHYLAPGGQIRIKVAWPEGLVVATGLPDKWFNHLRHNAYWYFALACLLLAIVLNHKRVIGVCLLMLALISLFGHVSQDWQLGLHILWLGSAFGIFYGVHNKPYLRIVAMLGLFACLVSSWVFFATLAPAILLLLSVITLTLSYFSWRRVV